MKNKDKSWSNWTPTPPTKEFDQPKPKKRFDWLTFSVNAWLGLSIFVYLTGFILFLLLIVKP